MPRRLFLTFPMFLLLGCGEPAPKLVTVTGSVTMKGQAVTAGAVYLHDGTANNDPKGKASGQLQLDGKFTLKTFPYGDGVKPGSYKVTLSPELAGRLGKPIYGDPTKTPWSLDVPESGVADKVFEVK